MKTTWTFILLTFCITTYAQIQKGRWLVGGSLSGSYQKGGALNNYRESSIQAPIQFGYMVGSGVAIGLRGQARYSEAKFEMRSTSYYPYYSYGTTYEVIIKSELYSVGPFVRVYVLPNNQKFNCYIEPHVGYGKYKGSDRLIVTGKSDNNYLNYNLSIAPVVFLNPNTSLEFILAYNYTSFNHSETNAFSYLFGVGFQTFLGKGKVVSKG
jgi:hypothetical protein